MNKVLKGDLSSLLEQQVKLDNYIHKTQKTNYQETFAERLMALCVELNELANETKCFKYGSVNKKIDYDKILEEYVDCLHFSLSLIIYYELPSVFEIDHYLRLNNSQLTIKFLELNQTFYLTQKKITFLEGFHKFLELSLQLGFDFPTVEGMYHKKCQINFARQNSGY